MNDGIGKNGLKGALLQLFRHPPLLLLKLPFAFAESLL